MTATEAPFALPTLKGRDLTGRVTLGCRIKMKQKTTSFDSNRESGLGV